MRSVASQVIPFSQGLEKSTFEFAQLSIVTEA